MGVEDKIRLELVPFNFIIEMAVVMQAGNNTGSRTADDWKELDTEAIERKRGSLLRHYANGEWAAVAVNAAMLWWHDQNNLSEVNREVGGQCDDDEGGGLVTLCGIHDCKRESDHEGRHHDGLTWLPGETAVMSSEQCEFNDPSVSVEQPDEKCVLNQGHEGKCRFNPPKPAEILQERKTT